SIRRNDRQNTRRLEGPGANCLDQAAMLSAHQSFDFRLAHLLRCVWRPYALDDLASDVDNRIDHWILYSAIFGLHVVVGIFAGNIGIEPEDHFESLSVPSGTTLRDGTHFRTRRTFTVAPISGYYNTWRHDELLLRKLHSSAD